MTAPSPAAKASSRLVLVALLALALGLLAGPAGASAKPALKKKPTSTFEARIGWFYNSEPDFPQQKMESAVIKWPACAAAGGVKLYFPLGQHIYGGYDGDFSTTKPAIAYIEGSPLNPKDPFVAEIYVGDMAEPGTRNLTMSCMHQEHGKLVAIMKGPLKTTFVHKDVNFNPPGVYDIFDQVDLSGLVTREYTVINRSCEEPGTPSITVSSPALAPGPSGGAYVTLPPSDEDGTFKGPITPATGVPPGKYEAVVSCGSGRVGVGKVGLDYITSGEAEP
jgi:hypothetical protein